MRRRTFVSRVKAGFALTAAGCLLALSVPGVAAGTDVSADTGIALSPAEPTEPETSTQIPESPEDDPAAATPETMTESPLTTKNAPVPSTDDKHSVEVEPLGAQESGPGYRYALRFTGDFSSASSLLLTSSNNGEGIVRIDDTYVDGSRVSPARVVVHPDDPFASAISVHLPDDRVRQEEGNVAEIYLTLASNDPGEWMAQMIPPRPSMRAFANTYGFDNWNTFSCRPGDVYTITANGRLALVRQTRDRFQVQYVGHFPGAGTNPTHNSLALGGSDGNGTSASRAYEVWTDPTNTNYIEVRRSDFRAPNDYWWYEADVQAIDGFSRTPFVGGAMKPTATEEEPFYFGRFITSQDPNSNETYFQMYAFDPRPRTRGIWFLGNIEMPYATVIPGDSNNGDIVLDPRGNLYLFWHTGDTVSVVPVAAGDLRSALTNSQAKRTNSYTTIPRGSTSSFTLGSTDAVFNGAALDADGTFFVQWSKMNEAPWMAKYDPKTGSLTKDTYLGFWPNGSPTGIQLGTDLASCQSFPTLELLKNLPSGRKRADDQFTLELWRKEDWDAKEGKAFLSATTAGNDTKVQQRKAGPFPVTGGDTYILAERRAGSTQHGDYLPSLKCNGIPVKNALLNKDGVTYYEITMPSNSAELVSCEYSNAPQGAVLWSKTGSDTGKPLAGSEWVVRNRNVNYAVKDCIGDGCATGADGTDIDPREGFFKLALPYGSYELAETKAPLGYRIGDPATRQFTVSSNAPEKNFGAIANPSARATLQWQKVDAESGKLLTGSEWSLVRTGPSTETQTLRKYPATITDCVAGDCSGLEDKNPEPGKFSLPNVDPGTYELVETKAPEGYVGGVKQNVTLTADQGGTSVSVGDLENERKKGSLTWGKIGSREGQIGVPTDPTMLGGSAWTITPIQRQGGEAVADAQSIVVEDCLASECTGPDSDARPGYFELELPIGWYRVEETRAPLGYKLLAQPKEVQVTANDTATLGNFTNEIVETPKLPKTGGRGIGVPLVAGVLIIACGAMLGRRRSL